MWYPAFRFALRSQLRRPFLWMLAAGFALATAWFIGTTRLQLIALFGGTTASAPRCVAFVIAGMSAFSLLVLASPLAALVLRDFETGMAQLVFATPVNPRKYLAGRMLAGLIIYLAVMGVVSLGALGGLAYVGDLHIGVAVYAIPWTFCWLVLPNGCLIIAAITGLASRARTIGWVYAGILVFYVLWALPLPMPGATAAMQRLSTAVTDPFGSRVLAQLPVLLGNVDTQLPSLSGDLLLNRVLWFSIAVLLAAWAIATFRVSRFPSRVSPRARRPSARDRGRASVPALTRERFHRSALTPAWALAVMGFRLIVGNTTFRLMLGLNVLLLLGIAFEGSGLYGTQSQLTMAWLLEALTESARLPLTFMLAVVAGGLVFRAKEAGMAGIEGSLPVSSGCRLLTDDLILIAMILIVHAMLLAVAVGLQVLNAGVTIEPVIYMEWLARSVTSFTVLALFARAVFGLVTHRAVGFALFAGIVIVARVGANRYPDYAWLAFAAPSIPSYTDLSGFFVSAGTWLKIALTWGAVIVALQAAVILISPPSQGTGVRYGRIKSMTAHPLAALLLFGGLIGAIAGADSLYRAAAPRVAEHAVDRQSDRAARYARAYAAYANVPQLRVRGVRAEVDFYPSVGRAEVRGTYTLVNTQSVPIDTLYVNLEPRDSPTLVPAQPYRTTLDDTDLGFRIIRLDTPVPPGGAIEVHFSAKIVSNDDDPTGTAAVIAKDGAMLTNAEYFPQFGYWRRKADPPTDLPAVVLPAARTADTHNSQIEGQADWIDFSAVVSTDADQMAFAPGMLERQWRSGARHYGVYRMRSKMLPYFAFASGRYEIARSHAGAVPIELYYDARHAVNVAGVLATARDSLSLFAGKLGAYPFGVLRLVEVAGNIDGAQSFPGMIVLSESSEFTRDMAAGSGHSLQFMLAHEMAHQWFAHQMIGADAPGANMLTESVAQYLALIELERTAGRQVALNAVRWDLDAYLTARPRAPGLERALSAEDGEAYLYYNKGAVAFWLLGQDLGEPVVTEVLSRFLADYRFKPAPYATSADLVSRLRAVASEAEGVRVEELLSGTAASERYRQEAGEVARGRDETHPYDLQFNGNKAPNLRARETAASTG
jgi:hypothetical protein